MVQPLDGLLERPRRAVAAAAHAGALDQVHRLPAHVGKDGALDRVGLGACRPVCELDADPILLAQSAHRLDHRAVLDHEAPRPVVPEPALVAAHRHEVLVLAPRLARLRVRVPLGLAWSGLGLGLGFRVRVRI